MDSVKNMVNDMFTLVKLTFTTSFGLTIFALVLALHFMSLLIIGKTGILGLLVTLLLLAGFIFGCYYTWFRGKSVPNMFI